MSKLAFIAYISVCFLLGIMLGNVLYSRAVAEPTAEQCLSVCVEAYQQFDILESYNEEYDYD